MTVDSIVRRFAGATALTAIMFGGAVPVTGLSSAIAGGGPSSQSVGPTVVAAVSLHGCPAAAIIDIKDGVIINRPRSIYICNATT